MIDVLNPKVTRVFTSELNDISGWWSCRCIPYSLCLLSKSDRKSVSSVSCYYTLLLHSAFFQFGV